MNKPIIEPADGGFQCSSKRLPKASPDQLPASHATVSIVAAGRSYAYETDDNVSVVQVLRKCVLPMPGVRFPMHPQGRRITVSSSDEDLHGLSGDGVPAEHRDPRPSHGDPMMLQKVHDPVGRAGEKKIVGERVVVVDCCLARHAVDVFTGIDGLENLPGFDLSNMRRQGELDEDSVKGVVRAQLLDKSQDGISIGRLRQVELAEFDAEPMASFPLALDILL